MVLVSSNQSVLFVIHLHLRMEVVRSVFPGILSDSNTEVMVVIFFYPLCFRPFKIVLKNSELATGLKKIRSGRLPVSLLAISTSA
jgi:hypothetical protein